ncbi:DinB family protein [Tenacibaculum agarivorans]|uniref:DinB family protein n=1 Tax=Tenacibaculum agarivorans TaxID=1908389 RepID=UPI00094B992D|nr:DinB family protein [Tenacibaculum agarivorans]
MDKTQINKLLEEKHQKLYNWLDTKEGDFWAQGPENKWTIGQHIAHLADANKRIQTALSIPSFILKAKFGKANRPVRSIEEIIKRYNEKLAANQEKAKEFNKNIAVPNKEEFEASLKVLKESTKRMMAKTLKFSDKKLDNVILPHPLLGKMPLREIIMWTAYHTEHHTKDLIENYS